MTYSQVKMRDKYRLPQSRPAAAVIVVTFTSTSLTECASITTPVRVPSQLSAIFSLGVLLSSVHKHCQWPVPVFALYPPHLPTATYCYSVPEKLLMGRNQIYGHVLSNLNLMYISYIICNLNLSGNERNNTTHTSFRIFVCSRHTTSLSSHCHPSGNYIPWWRKIYANSFNCTGDTASELVII